MANVVVEVPEEGKATMGRHRPAVGHLMAIREAFDLPAGQWDGHDKTLTYMSDRPEVIREFASLLERAGCKVVVLP